VIVDHVGQNPQPILAAILFGIVKGAGGGLGQAAKVKAFKNTQSVSELLHFD
jgi:hypothetical protein